MAIRPFIKIICCSVFVLASCAPPPNNPSSSAPPVIAEQPQPNPIRPVDDPKPKPSQPSWTYSTPAFGMTVAETSYPGISCALTDNRPTQSLMTAIQKLSAAVKPSQECAGDLDLQTANDQVTRLGESVKGLNQFWEHPELLSQGNNTAQFQNLLEASIRGIDQVGRNFSGNPLLNSKCAKGAMGVSDVFVAFTDLVTAFAPFALIGASMNPSLGVALPYVLGITGAGSAAKIVNKMLREQRQDATLPEVRNAILANICEYMKISDKVRFLKLAQSGQLEFVTREITSNGTQKLFNLYQLQPPNVKAMIQQRNLFQAQLEIIKENIPKDQAELLVYKIQLQGVTEKPMICEMARTMVVSAGETSRFPGRAIVGYKRLVASLPTASLAQQALIKTEESLRAQFTVAGGNPDTCASVGQSYIETVSRIIGSSADLYQIAIGTMTADLARQDKEFGTFVAKEAKTKKEVETVSRVSNILQRLNQDNAIIDKVEMNSQMLALKRALFSKPTDLVNLTAGLFGRGVGSPAMEYLNFISDQQALTTTQFSQEMQSLMDEIMYFKPTYDPYLRNPDGSVKLDRFGHMERKPREQADLDYFKELQRRSDLSIMTPALNPRNSENYIRNCQRLENIWLAWASVMDHLAAQSFFCSQIRSLFDFETDRDLVQRCDGKFDVSGNQTSKSGIQKSQTALAQPEFKGRALMVSEKLRELDCKMPDALIVMQGI